MTPMKFIRILLAAALLALPAIAQTVSIKGQVTDESSAIVPGATVTINGPGGLTKAAVSGNDGSYSFADLPAGAYTIRASAPGLTLRQAAKTTLRTGSQILNLQLNVVSEKPAHAAIIRHPPPLRVVAEWRNGGMRRIRRLLVATGG